VKKSYVTCKMVETASHLVQQGSNIPPQYDNEEEDTVKQQQQQHWHCHLSLEVSLSNYLLESFWICYALSQEFFIHQKFLVEKNSLRIS
jgi:hypothetical protein